MRIRRFGHVEIGHPVRDSSSHADPSRHLKFGLRLVSGAHSWENPQDLVIEFNVYIRTVLAGSDGDTRTMDEFAVHLKAGKRTVCRLVARGEIPALRLGGTCRFRCSELGHRIAASINDMKPKGRQ